MTLLATPSRNGDTLAPAGSEGVLPDPRTPVPDSAEGAPIEPDSNAAALTEALMKEADDRRVLATIDFGNRYRGDLGAAVRLARAAFEEYDRRFHKLTHLGADLRQPGEIGYAEFFREVAFNEFRACHNVWAAGQVFDRMVTEAAS